MYLPENNSFIIHFEDKPYHIFYSVHSSGSSRHFNVTIIDEKLRQITGETLEYVLNSRDNLEELNYPPIKDERDLLLKKTIISEIFKKEKISYTV